MLHKYFVILNLLFSLYFSLLRSLQIHFAFFFLRIPLRFCIQQLPGGPVRQRRRTVQGRPASDAGRQRGFAAGLRGQRSPPRPRHAVSDRRREMRCTLCSVL